MLIPNVEVVRAKLNAEFDQIVEHLSHGTFERAKIEAITLILRDFVDGEINRQRLFDPYSKTPLA